jgi:flavin reductase (DIM6/NTAB) family NADH-FMN oxidoreductase RutF
LTTGSNPVPEIKVRRGYRHEPDKFKLAGLTAIASETVAAPRVAECAVQLEARVEAVHGIADDDVNQKGSRQCFEVRVQRVHVDESILMADDRDRIDPDKWRPLIMSFQQFYGLGSRLHESALGTIPESAYRGPDIARAREVAP